MIGQIIFTLIAFILFVYIFLIKLIKKNDTTYLIILAMQATGILLNLIRISFEKLNGVFFTFLLYCLCIIIPIAICILEHKKINVSEILRIVIAQLYIFVNKPKKAKKVLLDLVHKYKNSYIGHKKLAQIYEKEGGLRRAIEKYVYALDIRKNDYESYYNISVLLNKLGRKEDAIEMLRNLLKYRPNTYEASMLLR